MTSPDNTVSPANVIAPKDGDADSPELIAHITAIRSLSKQTVANVIEIGERLTKCKRIVGHGGWYSWLRREFDWSRQTADNLINVFEASKTLNFSDLNLPISSLYLLAAPNTPPEVSKEIVERASKGEKLKHADVKAAVKGNPPNPSAAPATLVPAEQSKGADVIALRPMPNEPSSVKPHRERPKSKELRDQEIAVQVNAMRRSVEQRDNNEIARLKKVILALEDEITTLRQENTALRAKLSNLQADYDPAPKLH